VSGALLGGLFSGVGFAIVVATFNHLANNHTDLHGLYATFAHIAAVLPALIGIGLGRNPSGAMHDIVEMWRPMRRAKPVLAAGAAAAFLLYMFALTGVITNWWFVILIFVLLSVLPIIGKMMMPEAFLGAEEVARRRATVPDELIGIDAPYTPQLRDALDRALGFEATPKPAAPTVSQEPQPSYAPVGAAPAAVEASSDAPA
jgi:hypothetical protein